MKTRPSLNPAIRVVGRLAVSQHRPFVEADLLPEVDKGPQLVMIAYTFALRYSGPLVYLEDVGAYCRRTRRIEIALAVSVLNTMVELYKQHLVTAEHNG